LAAGEDAEIAGPVLIAGEAECELVIAGRDLECGGSGAGELAVEIDFGAGGIRLESDGGRGGIGLCDRDELAVFEKDEERGIVQPGLRFEVYLALWGAESGDDLLAGHAGRKCGGNGWRGSWGRNRSSDDGCRRGCRRSQGRSNWRSCGSDRLRVRGAAFGEKPLVNFAINGFFVAFGQDFVRKVEGDGGPKTICADGSGDRTDGEEGEIYGGRADVNVGDVKALTNRKSEILVTAEKLGVEAVDSGGGDLVPNDRAVEPLSLHDHDGTRFANIGFRAGTHHAFAEFGGLVGLGENLFEDDALIEGFLRNGQEGEKKEKGGASRHGKSIEGMARKRKI
jgi:hypothetical protein